MKEKFILSKKFVLICVSCIAIGIAALTYGFISDPHRTWSNYLLNNFYFFSLSIGAAFFLAIQAITRSGWSSGFRRVPEAMMMYLPIAGVLLLFLYFGMHHLYPWSNSEIKASHEIIQHRFGYLNIPFFFTRIIIFFALWIVLTRLIRKASIKEDEVGGIENYTKIERYSKILIFVLAISFSILGIVSISDNS